MPDYRPPHLDSTAERPQAPVPEAAEAPPAPVEAGPPEPQCRFSQASLWQYQLQYYREAGVDVWRSGTVPSLISNNAAMARIWADTICAWLHDHEETLDLNEPLYVIELGAGAGRLAFLILKALSARRPTDPLLRKVKLKYVLTDIAEGTVDFWRNHPPLRPFHDNGSLDVAEWSPTSGEPLKLSKRRAPLSALRNPPIVIANYLIDSLPADVFAVENATLFEHMVTLTPLVDSFPKMEFDNVPAGAEPYGDPSLDSMLQFYRRKLTKGLFVFPIDALKAFENMERLFGPEMMILVADMGSSRVGAFEDITQWHPSFFDGAMAVDCNFHALGHWVKERGGTFLDPDDVRSSFRIGAYVLGKTPPLHHVQRTLRPAMQSFGPFDMMNLVMLEQGERVNMGRLLAAVHLSEHDPLVFGHLAPFFDDALMMDGSVTETDAVTVVKAMQKVIANDYGLGDSAGLAYAIARLAHRIGAYELAIWGYETTMAHLGDDVDLLMNIGWCEQALGQRKAAIATLRRVIHIEPMNQDAIATLRKLTK